VMKYKNEEQILLVLDIDETLIHATEQEMYRKSDFQVYDYHVYQRPYLKEFLMKVSEDFLLAVWSSASDEYVDEIVRRIFPKDIQLEFVWGRSRCTYRRNLQIDEYGYYSDEYFSHYHYVKPLKKLKRKGYQLERILIIDDTPHKSKDNYGNVIYPNEYKGDLEDNDLRKLSKYLPLLKDETNVRTIEKRSWRSKI